MTLTNLNSNRDLLRTWFFWKRQAILILFLIVGLVIAFSYIITPKFKSTAKILLLPKTSEGVIISAGTDEKRIAPLSLEDLNTEIELLNSDAVFNDTVTFLMKENIELKENKSAWYHKITKYIVKMKSDILVAIKFKEPLSVFDSSIANLRNSISVEPVAKSNIIIISLISENPKSAAITLDKLMENYIKHHNNVFTKEGGVQFFHVQAENYRTMLENAENKLKEYQIKSNIVDLEMQNKANIELLADVRPELRQLEISFDEAVGRIQMLRKGLEKGNNDILITKEMRTIPSIVELDKAIVPLLIERSDILKNFTKTSREYLDIQNQIAELRKDMRNEILKAIRTDELELESVRIRKDSLQVKINTLQKEANELSQNTSILRNMERDVELFKNNYLLYASKAEDARIFSQRKKHDLANVTIADSATVPVKPISPNRPLMALISVMLGFVAALGTPFFLEHFDHNIKTAHQVEAHLSIPVICSFKNVRS